MLAPRHIGLAALGAALAVAAGSTSAQPNEAAAAAPARTYMWISPGELKKLPMRGTAWGNVRRAAEGDPGTPDLSDQDSDHDVRTLAAALVYARTGDASYRAKAVAAILGAIGTEDGGRTLALGRGLVSYVIAADLVDLRTANPDGDARFRAWLAAVRHEELPRSAGRWTTLVKTHELSPNNWGALAGASRIAAAIYLGDRRDLARAARVFQGWLGNRGAYVGFQWSYKTSWHADPAKAVAVNPPGATRDGRSIDGALPDELRRGCDLRFPPCYTSYPWEALQGAVVQAELLTRQGYRPWRWSSRALLRAARFLEGLSTAYPQPDEDEDDWWAPSPNTWVPWILNYRYGTKLPAVAGGRPGRGVGFADWTHQAARR